MKVNNLKRTLTVESNIIKVSLEMGQRMEHLITDISLTRPANVSYEKLFNLQSRIEAGVPIVTRKITFYHRQMSCAKSHARQLLVS